MSEKVQAFAKTVVSVSSSVGGALARAVGQVSRRQVIAVAVLGALGYGVHAVVSHPPIKDIAPGEVGMRVNQWTGSLMEFRQGTALVIPGIHRLRIISLREQTYRPERGARADGDAPYQSLEGLSIGIDLKVRYALDPARIEEIARKLPDDVDSQVVEPMVQAIAYRTFPRYTVREIFSAKRAEIQQIIESELKPKLAADGIQLRAVMIGKVDLPRDYRAGMEQLQAEELATQKMRFTLELKEKVVREHELDAEAEKVGREKAAEAAGNEQIIAAKAQAEAMRHVLPFKEKQIQQRQMEAEAEKISRVKSAEANAQSRLIEATGEADSRVKLADADAYRQEKLGKLASEQLARDGASLTRNPLLIQKTMADKLSDKISVMIVPPPTDGAYIGSALLGMGKPQLATAPAADNFETSKAVVPESAEQGKGE